MSIAWGSLVLLILLLPGVLFFVGLYIPEQFTRETSERSPLGQLAATLLVSFLVHGLLYVTFGSLCGHLVPCMSVQALLDVITVDPIHPRASSTVDSMLFRFRLWIFLYVLLTCVLGVGAGWLTGLFAIRTRLKSLTQHTWIYDLSVGDNFTVAYVMTHVKHDERVLMYQGFLKAFGLQRDGRFSYMVLTDAVRGYMHLAENGPVTSATNEWHAIGHTADLGAGPLSLKSQQKRRDRSYFVIEGEDIANAVFDRLAFDYNTPLQSLKSIITTLQEEFQKQVAASSAGQRRPAEGGGVEG